MSTKRERVWAAAARRESRDKTRLARALDLLADLLATTDEAESIERHLQAQTGNSAIHTTAWSALNRAIERTEEAQDNGEDRAA